MFVCVAHSQQLVTALIFPDYLQPSATCSGTSWRSLAVQHMCRYVNEASDYSAELGVCLGMAETIFERVLAWVSVS